MSPDYAHPERVREPGLRGRILPTTPYGRLAGWFAVGFAVWFFVISPLVMAFQGEVQRVPRLLLIPLSWIGFGSGLVAGVLSLLAIVRQRERSVLAFLFLVPALIVATFLLGELLVPH